MTNKSHFKSTRVRQAEPTFYGAPVSILEGSKDRTTYRPIFGVILNAAGSTTSIESKRTRKAKNRNK